MTDEEITTAAEMVADLVDNRLMSCVDGIALLAEVTGMPRLMANVRLALTLHHRDWVPLSEWQRRWKR